MEAWRAAGLVLALCAGPLHAETRCADYVPQAKPQNTAREEVGVDLDTILERGFIEFALYEDFAPWSFEEGGRAKGIDVEIGEMIAESLGVTAKFQLVTPGETLEADLRNWVWKGPVVSGHVANVMLHVPYDSNFTCRVEQVTFTGLYHVEEVAIAYRVDLYPDGGPTPAYFRFDTVAVENDSIADFYLSSFPGGQLSGNVQRLKSTTQAMAALARGEVKAAMGPKGELEAGLVPGLKVHTPPLPGFAVGKWTLGAAVHFAWKDVAYAVDDALGAAIADGRMAAIFARYGVSFNAPELR
jgi:ABC-type amino acid transport substrate-binding protein